MANMGNNAEENSRHDFYINRPHHGLGEIYKKTSVNGQIFSPPFKVAAMGK